jgi:magnesium transporter
VERVLEHLPPAALAEVVPELGPADVRALFDVLLAAGRPARRLRELPLEVLAGALDCLDDSRLVRTLGQLPPDEALYVARALAPERCRRAMSQLPPERREELERLSAYPEGTAGNAMTTRFLAVRESATAEETIDAIRRHSEEEVEQIFEVYVTDETGRLRGSVPIRKLVSCPPRTPVGRIMVCDPVAVRATVDREEAAAVVARHNLPAVPVVDEEDRLLGVITVDDVVDVIQEEATEDMFRLVGLAGGERVSGPLGRSFARRLPWTLVNVAAAALVAGVVGLFETSIRQAAIVAAFLPMVVGMGGHGALQSLAVVTRGLAVGQLEIGQALRAVGRQAAIGLGLGAAAGTVGALFGWAWRGEVALGAVVFFSLLVTMTVAGFSGAAIPLLLRAAGRDPIHGSAVVASTVTAIVGVAWLLGIAAFLLPVAG